MFGSKERSGRVVDWSKVDHTLMGDLVSACSVVGCSILFGSTRDKGAWSLTFYWDHIPANKNGKHSETVYCNSEDMLEDWLTEWIHKWMRIAQAAQEG